MNPTNTNSSGNAGSHIITELSHSSSFLTTPSDNINLPRISYMLPADVYSQQIISEEAPPKIQRFNTNKQVTSNVSSELFGNYDMIRNPKMPLPR